MLVLFGDGTVTRHRSPTTQEVRMTSTTISRSANEAAWHASGAALYAGDIDAFLAYWQPDGRYEVAYPIAGLPPAVEGHDALRQIFTGFGALADWIRVDDVRFHATADRDVAFVEEHMSAQLKDGGRYENDMCLRVTFRDGLIASIFEYYGERAHTELVERFGLAADAPA
jgi:ketosteroid isomerase-like protein